MTERLDNKDTNSTDTSDEKKPTKDAEKSKEKHTKKSHKKLKVFAVILAVVLIIPLFVGGWYGFVPGLSSLLGANKARDLGVSFTEADFESYKQKTSMAFYDFENSPENPKKPGKKTVFADPKTVENMIITQEEIAAAAYYTNWAWIPLTNAQVRFSDGAAEVSGNINMEHIDDFIKFAGGVGYSQEDIDKAISYGKRFLGNSPAIYIRSKASVTNDQLSYALESIQINRYSVPMDIAEKVLSTGTTNAILKADNFEVGSATLVDGAIDFTGTYPTTVYVKH